MTQKNLTHSHIILEISQEKPLDPNRVIGLIKNNLKTPWKNIIVNKVKQDLQDGDFRRRLMPILRSKRKTKGLLRKTVDDLRAEAIRITRNLFWIKTSSNQEFSLLSQNITCGIALAFEDYIAGRASLKRGFHYLEDTWLLGFLEYQADFKKKILVKRSKQELEIFFKEGRLCRHPRVPGQDWDHLWEHFWKMFEKELLVKKTVLK